MAFKMKGMNFGAGTGSVLNSPMTKKTKTVRTSEGKAKKVKTIPDPKESTRKVTPPTPPRERKYGDGENTNTSPMKKPGDRAAKLATKADKLKAKRDALLRDESGEYKKELSKGEAKKHQRLYEREQKKRMKSRNKKKMQENIDAGAKTRKEKRAGTQTWKQYNIGDTTKTKIKDFDEKGEKTKTMITERGDGSVKKVQKDKGAGTKTKTDTRNPEKDYVKDKKNRGDKTTEQSFGDAFKGARSEGKKEFEWKGGKYHTRTKEEEAQRKASEEADKKKQ